MKLYSGAMMVNCINNSISTFQHRCLYSLQLLFVLLPSSSTRFIIRS